VQAQVLAETFNTQPFRFQFGGVGIVVASFTVALPNPSLERTPPAWHLARAPASVIIRRAGQAPIRWCPLSSNVRPHEIPFRTTTGPPRKRCNEAIYESTCTYLQLVLATCVWNQLLSADPQITLGLTQHYFVIAHPHEGIYAPYRNPPTCRTRLQT
jgi:hypothetical protein